MMTQARSQKILKGKPKTTGVARSQSGTEKQTPMNGIEAISKAPSDGLFTSASTKRRGRREGEQNSRGCGTRLPLRPD